MYITITLYMYVYNYYILYVCIYIGECSTLDVGLTGIVRNLIQKSTKMDAHLLSISFFPFRMSKASDNTKAAMKKQVWRIHSVFSHVRIHDLLVFFCHSSQFFKAFR